MLITIASWDDYNPRKDLVRMHWVRIENSITTSRKLFGLAPDQKWVWVCLLAVGAQQNREGVVDLDLDYLSHVTGVEGDRALAALRHFAKRNLITIDYGIEPDRNPGESDRNTNGSGTNPIENVPYVTERNGTERNEEKTLSPPRRMRKTPPLEPKYQPCDLNLATRWWNEHAKVHAPHLVPNLSRWADGIRKLRELDKMTLEEVTRLFEWVKDDEFWAKNALSPEALRGVSTKTGLKKVDTIRARMRETPGNVLDDWDDWAKKMDAEMAAKERR